MKVLILLALLGVVQSQLSVNTMRVCTVNADCVAYGDLGGECDRVTGRCTCTTNNYKRIIEGTKIFYHCVAQSETLAQSRLRVTEVVLGMTFTNAQCTANATFAAPFETAVRAVIPDATFVNIYHQCVVQPAVAGSLGTYTAVHLRIPVSRLFTTNIENFQTLILARLTTPQLTPMGNVITGLTAHTTPGMEFLCPRTANTRTMATFSTAVVQRVCKSIQCTGTEFEIAAGQDTCTRTVRFGGVFSDSDDELSGGVIAGIIIGVCALVIIVVIIGVCCCRESEDEDEGENDKEVDGPDDE